MLTFEKINEDNIQQVAEFFRYKTSRTCDYTIGAMYMWRDFYHTHFAIYEGMLLYRVNFLNRTSFTIPIGNGSLDKAMEALKHIVKKMEYPYGFAQFPK